MAGPISQELFEDQEPSRTCDAPIQRGASLGFPAKLPSNVIRHRSYVLNGFLELCGADAEFLGPVLHFVVFVIVDPISVGTALFGEIVGHGSLLLLMPV